LAPNIPSTEIALNAALRTADVKVICAFFDAAILGQKNVSELAQKAGIDRSQLYRTFRAPKGPRSCLS
jgi:DNA-binding phage protein